MKKAILLLILIFNCIAANARVVKDYFIENDFYYILFCPENVEELKIEGDGGIEFFVNSDIENSKNFITMVAHKKSGMSINIETDEEIYTYNITSDINAPENCDENLIRMDVDAQLPKEKFSNKEFEENIMPDSTVVNLRKGIKQ